MPFAARPGAQSRPQTLPSPACDPGNGLSRHGASTRCSPSAVTTRLSRKCVYGRNIPRTPTSGKARQHAGRLPGRLRHPGAADDVDQSVDGAGAMVAITPADAADGRQNDALALATHTVCSVTDAKGSSPGLAVEPGGTVREAAVFPGPDPMAQGVDGTGGGLLGQLLAPWILLMP